jgi:hypothetical protein
MLSKCANPVCSTQLHYLRDGKVFKVEMSRPVPIDSRKPLRRVEHFWLCGPCSTTQTLSYDQEYGVRILPKTQQAVPLIRRAAAS